MKKDLQSGDKVTVMNRPEVLTIVNIHDGYATTQRDHGHTVTAGYYPLVQLVPVAGSPPSPQPSPPGEGANAPAPVKPIK